MKQLSAWRLFRKSLSEYRSHWRILVGVVAVVAVPVSLFTTYFVANTTNASTSNTSSTSTAYITFAQLCMNAALIYTVIQLYRDKAVSMRRAYYVGSAPLVRLVLVAFLLVLSLLPMVLGLKIIEAGLPVPGEVQLAGGEMALLALVAFIVAIPSIFLIARTIWAIYVIFETDLGPIQAIKASWRMTRGHTWQAVGRLFALVCLLFLLVLVPLIVLYALGKLTGWRLFGAILQLALSLIVLPVSNLYMYGYYRELKK
jgi:hypothetical protein